MSSPVEFTGERFLPECSGEIWAEHWHRYLFAAKFVGGKKVLDAACGEGYGSAWLARYAGSVVGLDLDQPTVTNARAKYRAPNLTFETGSVAAMPFADASFDCAVSFETLEHLAEQDEMLAELRRVLKPDGFLVISTPNRVEYSEKRSFHNEFHVRELDEPEFRALLARHFPAQRWFGQKLLFNSAVWPLPETSLTGPEWISIDDSTRRMPAPMYFVAMAAASASSIPQAAPLTLLADPDDAMYREYEQTVSRAATLEQLTMERQAILADRDRHIRHLETLAIEREHIVEERDRQLAGQSARASAMEKLIAEREQLVVLRDKVIAEKDRVLAATNERAAELERLVAERETIIVERDAELAALNRRVETAEKLVAARDATLAAVNARIAEAERLIAHREQVIVERDSQLAAVNARAATLEGLVTERERIIVERDAQLQAGNALRGTLEALVGERDQQLQAVVQRSNEIEQVVVLRDQQLADHQGRLAQAATSIATLQSEKQALRDEVTRRGGWRWWLALPYHRIRRGLNPAPPATGQGRS